jgi:ABC-type transporter Mla subunit MlaD
MVRLLVGLIAVLALCTGAAYYLFQENVSFHVIFSDAKNLTAGDDVYLAGRPVGKVIEVKPDNGQVTVAVHVERKYRDQITRKSSFFIGPNIATTGHMSLLVRTPASDRGGKLNPEDKVDGIDSFMVWSSLGLADKVHEMVSSEHLWKDLLREVDFIAQDFKKAIK